MSEQDEQDAVWFKKGWDAALAEAFLRYDHGGADAVDEFRREQTRSAS